MGQTQCPVCGGRRLEPLLTLPEIPAMVNRLADDAGQARRAPRGSQRLAGCLGCGFVFNTDFEPEKVVYQGEYHAERGQSPYYARHMQRVLDWIERQMPFRGKRVLEVGSGGGEFLREVLRRGPRCGVGVDPCGPDAPEGTPAFHRAALDARWFNENPMGGGGYHILINRHMIEHIQTPLEMLRLFRRALAPDGMLYLETPRLEWILESRAFYDFPYEHCAYYTDDFLKRLLQMAGFSVIALEHGYAGQYFSVCAGLGQAVPPEPPAEPEWARLREGFAAVAQALQSARRARLPEGLAGGAYLWGAAAKGVMCANLLPRGLFAGAVDKNPCKQNKYIPGTGMPVLAPSALVPAGAKAVFVENSVYLAEIQEEVRGLEPRIRVYPLERLLQGTL